MKKIKGFSLLEALIAISIVALIAVSALPLFMISSNNVKSGQDDSVQLFELQSAIENDSLERSGVGRMTFRIEEDIIEIDMDKYRASGTVKPDVFIDYFKYKDKSSE